MGRIIHHGLLKNRNEYDSARHRYETKVKEKKRAEARKSKNSQAEAGQGIRSVDTQKG